MASLAEQLGEEAGRYAALAERVAAGFERFWNAPLGYCYDVLDAPAGPDGSLRPNQLLAVSLPHSPLSAERQRSIVDTCARHLLTPHGPVSYTHLDVYKRQAPLPSRARSRAESRCA